MSSFLTRSTVTFEEVQYWSTQTVDLGKRPHLDPHLYSLVDSPKIKDTTWEELEREEYLLFIWLVWYLFEKYPRTRRFKALIELDRGVIEDREITGNYLK